MAISISYQLDTLGSMQFENLIQELLIAELGLGVEAWGGSADHGRDAYCSSELNFPNRRITNPGPFLFQVKFISGANATGAKFDKELTAAVMKEAELIQRRIELKKSKAPRHYGLFTNAPVTAAQRDKVKMLLEKALPKATLTIQGAPGICGMLDTNISVARAFPQMLSLRSLTDLLKNVVRHGSIQRSDAAIKEAEGLTQIFVPTKAYDEAWQVLSKHNFVVLEGPPEMGKTAIAWMIAAVQLAQKWEAVDCDSPDDFFDGYENSDRQVFVADDAFGTTEYETTRGSNWGRQLHKILPKLNAKHWLVWTSRGHILNKALQEMSLQGKATSFPKPAEVIVNASKIDRRERALILYRHARAAALEDVAKNIVRQNAATIIDNSHFTPERIKRFVLEELPDLSQALINGEMEAVDVPDRIDRAIEHPTERMEKAFAKLDSGQKWLLIALLDCERSPNLKDLESVYRRFWEMQRPMEDEVHLLEEGFLLITAGSGSTLIDWIHPSYRDLVIDELEKNETAALRFLERCSLPGIRLAVSVAGGATGDRRFPLMSTPKSWDILQKRVLELINQSADEFVILSLLGTLRTGIAAAIDEPTILSHLSGILNQCCQEAKVQLDKTNKSIWPILLKAIFRSTIELTPPPPMPSMYASLKKVEDEFAENLRLAEDDKSRLDASTVEDWADTVSVIAKSDQRLLIQSGFPDAYGSRIEKLCLLVVSEIDTDPPLDSDDAFESQITRMRDLSGALEELVGMIPKLDKRLRRISRKAEKRAKALQKRHAETLSGGESEEELPDELRRNQPFDLDRLFADL